jgi:hypothetical protein
MLRDDWVGRTKPGISLSGGIAEGHSDILIVAIDPGEVNIGVCLYDPGRKTVLNFSNFNLHDYTPSKGESKLSCYTGDKAVTTNIGQCVLRMIHRNHRLFMPFGTRTRKTVGDSTIRKCVVVIEKQWNISTNNCCVLSSIQSFYTNKTFSGADEYTEYECHILHPSKLNKHFPQTFVGTDRNKPLRKKRILSDGKKLVGMIEMKDALKYHTGCEEERRKVKEGTKDVTIHALDAMFYAFAMCVMHPDIKDDPYARRLGGNSQLGWLVRNRLKKHEKEKEKVDTTKKNTKKRKRSSPKESDYSSTTPVRGRGRRQRQCKKRKDHHADAIDLITPPNSPHAVI